jgi:hypothetical protein
VSHDKNAKKVELQEDYKTQAVIGSEVNGKVRNVVNKKTGEHKVVRIVKKQNVVNVEEFDKKFNKFK